MLQYLRKYENNGYEFGTDFSLIHLGQKAIKLPQTHMLSFLPSNIWSSKIYGADSEK